MLNHPRVASVVAVFAFTLTACPSDEPSQPEILGTWDAQESTVTFQADGRYISHDKLTNVDTFGTYTDLGDVLRTQPDGKGADEQPYYIEGNRMLLAAFERVTFGPGSTGEWSLPGLDEGKQVELVLALRPDTTASLRLRAGTDPELSLDGTWREEPGQVLAELSFAGLEPEEFRFDILGDRIGPDVMTRR
jgi:hypothetical protein